MDVVQKNGNTKLENISAVSTNSVVSIIFDYDSFFDTNPQTLSPLGDLLNILTPKCGRLRFDLKCEAPEDYSFPLLQYPALLHYNEIEFTETFAKYLKKDDVIEFLHQKSENHRKNPIRMRIMFPEIEWAEYLIQKIVAMGLECLRTGDDMGWVAHSFAVFDVSGQAQDFQAVV
ncbi:hypothetical protein Ddc_24116 [Ditylenchus destructor]|nr:hypothetical protein Ddc_24116 [Ditylenchus destructor]